MSLIGAIIKFVIVAACLFYFYTVIADARSSVRERKKKKEKKAERERLEKEREEARRERERIKKEGFVNKWGIRCWGGSCWICGGRNDQYGSMADARPCSTCYHSLEVGFGYEKPDTGETPFVFGEEIKNAPSTIRKGAAGAKLHYAMQFSEGNITREVLDEKMKMISRLIKEEEEKERIKSKSRPVDVRNAAAELSRRL